MIKKILLLLFISLLSITNVKAQDVTCEYSDGIYHVIIPEGTKIEFVSKKRLMTNEEVHKELGALLTVNAGFFDPKNQKTISFVYNDGILQESPIENENLVFNETIMDNWDKVSNRTEFRVTLHNGLTCYDIAPHNDAYKGRLIASAQAGPMLLPQLKLEDEFFIVKNNDGKIIRQSASVLVKTARTLIGIKDGNVHIFVVTNKHPMTIYEARNLCKYYGMEKAMAFDGGSSTSLDYKDEIHVTSIGTKDDNTGRKLKSFLVVMP